jgi:hypothetical protein
MAEVRGEEVGGAEGELLPFFTISVSVETALAGG